MNQDFLTPTQIRYETVEREIQTGFDSSYESCDACALTFFHLQLHLLFASPVYVREALWYSGTRLFSIMSIQANN